MLNVKIHDVVVRGDDSPRKQFDVVYDVLFYHFFFTVFLPAFDGGKGGGTGFATRIYSGTWNDDVESCKHAARCWRYLNQDNQDNLMQENKERNRKRSTKCRNIFLIRGFLTTE